MTEIQKHIMKLMDEIVDACNNQSLKYIMHGQTAGCAIKFGKFKTGAYPFHIFMLASDIDKLKNCLGTKNSRQFEDKSTNGAMNTDVVRYVDTSTTLFDRKEAAPYKVNGACVFIHPIYDYNLLAKKPGFIKRIFGGAKKCYYQVNEAEYKEFPREFINATKKIAFEGRKLAVPQSSDSYFEFLLGNEWRSIYAEQMQSTNSSFVIWDANTSYTEYLKEFDSMGVNIYDVFSELRELDSFLANEYEPKKQIVDADYEIALECVERVVKGR